MNQQQLKQKLTEYGYPERFIDIVSKELLNISEALKPIVENWLTTGEEKDYSCDGYSLLELCDTKQLKYPAAILTMDWIIKEPDMAIKTINRKKR